MSAPLTTKSGRWKQFLRRPLARWTTPSLLVALTLVYVVLLLRVPFWWVFLPLVIIGHRIGVLLHEFIHGIPFRRYRNNHNVVTLFDGLFLMWGTLEVFRGTHLAHHRWLNTDLDPARESDKRTRTRGLAGSVAALEAFQYLAYMRDAWLGRKPYVDRTRIIISVVISAASVLFWTYIGHANVIWTVMAVNLFTTLVPVSLRGAVEHYSSRGDPGFANEYRVWIPLFNLNRHIHHHENPGVPWYLLEFRTAQPLSHWHYFTHWLHVYVTHDFFLMQPEPDGKQVGAHPHAPP